VGEVGRVRGVVRGVMWRRQMACRDSCWGDSCRQASSRGVPRADWGGHDVAVGETGVWGGASRDAQLEEIHVEIQKAEIQKDAPRTAVYISLCRIT